MKYRKAFFVRKLPGMDEEALSFLCETSIFLTLGSEGYGSQEDTMRKKLKSRIFDPAQDVIVPSGPSWINLLLGLVLAELWSGSWINFAIYNRKSNRYTVVSKKVGHANTQ